MSIPENTILNTCEGPNPICKIRTDPAWHSCSRQVQIKRLLDGPKRVRKSCDLTHSIVRLVDFRARVPFFVIQNLNVDCLLKTSFIDHHGKAVLRGPGRLVFRHSFSVAVIGERFLLKLNESLTLELRNRFRKVGTTQKVTIPPRSQAIVQT